MCSNIKKEPSISVKEIHSGTLHSSKLKDFYLYFLRGYLPNNTRMHKSMVMRALNLLLLKDFFLTSHQKMSMIMTYKCAFQRSALIWLVNFYHASLLGSYLGITRIYNSIRKHLLHSQHVPFFQCCIMTCQECQMSRKP